MSDGPTLVHVIAMAHDSTHPLSPRLALELGVHGASNDLGMQPTTVMAAKAYPR